MQIKINKIKEFLNQKNIYGYLVTKNDEHFKSPDNLKVDILRHIENPIEIKGLPSKLN